MALKLIDIGVTISMYIAINQVTYLKLTTAVIILCEWLNHQGTNANLKILIAVVSPLVAKFSYLWFNIFMVPPLATTKCYHENVYCTPGRNCTCGTWKQE